MDYHHGMEHHVHSYSTIDNDPSTTTFGGQQQQTSVMEMGPLLSPQLQLPNFHKISKNPSFVTSPTNLHEDYHPNSIHVNEDTLNSHSYESNSIFDFISSINPAHRMQNSYETTIEKIPHFSAQALNTSLPNTPRGQTNDGHNMLEYNGGGGHNVNPKRRFTEPAVVVAMDGSKKRTVMQKKGRYTSNRRARRPSLPLNVRALPESFFKYPAALPTVVSGCLQASAGSDTHGQIKPSCSARTKSTIYNLEILNTIFAEVEDGRNVSHELMFTREMTGMDHSAKVNRRSRFGRNAARDVKLVVGGGDS